jgi:transmembrane sensor
MHDSPRQPDVNAPDREWEAFARYVAGESHPDEVRTVEAWLAANPADARLLGSVKDHADTAAAAADITVDVNAAFAKVRGQLGAPATAPLDRLRVERGGAGSPGAPIPGTPIPGAPRPSTARARSPFMPRLVMAVAATVLAFVGWQVWQPKRGADAGSERMLATGIGQRDSVMLSDGSKVVLAPGSRLTVAADFDRGNRLVTLDGAAYFDVHHDEAHPFTVRSGGAEIRDIGTAFTVKTDAAGDVTVAVTHGIVALRGTKSAASSSVELRAGDRGTVSAENVAVARGTVTDEETSWTRGQLSYRDTPLSEVQADLKRWYGIDLEIGDSILARRTVTMPSQPDSARVLSAIVMLLGAERTQRGDTVILHSAGRGTTP